MNTNLRLSLALHLAALLVTAPVLADPISTTKDAIALADSAMKKIAVDDIQGAIDVLKPHASVDFGEVNGWTRTVVDTYRARPAGFGDSLGYTFEADNALADTVLRVTFIQKFSRKPLEWDFFFYKPRQEWLIWEFQFRGSGPAMFNIPGPYSPPPALQPPAR